MSENQAHQPRPQAKRLPFWKLNGQGIMYTKVTPHNVIRNGQMSLPDIGLCYIEGLQSVPQYFGTDKSPVTLELKSATTRKVVAKLTMDGMRGLDKRDATITAVGKRKPLHKAVITKQMGEAGAYLRIFVPGVATLGPRRPNIG